MSIIKIGNIINAHKSIKKPAITYSKNPAIAMINTIPTMDIRSPFIPIAVIIPINPINKDAIPSIDVMIPSHSSNKRIQDYKSDRKNKL